MSTDYQSIVANGRASDLASDSIDVVLNNINLDYLLSYTEASKAISIMGPVTGQAQVYSVFSAPMLEAQAQIRNGGINGVYLGDVNAEAILDRENNSILIYGQAVDSNQHVVANVEGKVIPATKWWGLDITCDSVAKINDVDYEKCIIEFDDENNAHMIPDVIRKIYHAKINNINIRGGDHMTRQHFNAGYPAEGFGLADITSVLDESQRSKSREHTDRLQYNENLRKTEKIEENEI